MFTNWNFMRVLRLALGIMVIIQGIQTGQWMLSILGIFFSLMPLFNVGCCAGGNCNVPQRRASAATPEDVSYEEVV